MKDEPMGYTTKFSGVLKFNKPIPVELARILATLFEADQEEIQNVYGGEVPDSYCQWALSNDGTGIVWDGGEKFYMYCEWLNYIETNILRKWGVILDGELEYQGEEVGDCGIIRRMPDGDRWAVKLTAPGKIECPDCGHIFIPGRCG